MGMILVLPTLICLFVSVVCALFDVLNVFQMDLCATRRINTALNKALSVFRQVCSSV